MTGDWGRALRAVLRFLTPRGWAAVLVLAVAILLLGLLGSGVGVKWDPFGVERRRLAAAQDLAFRRGAEVSVLRAEAEGRERQVERQARHHDETEAVRRVTAEAITQARSSHDASEAVDNARLDRMRAHDLELCRIAPVLDGCAAAAGAGR